MIATTSQLFTVADWEFAIGVYSIDNAEQMVALFKDAWPVRRDSPGEILTFRTQQQEHKTHAYEHI